MKAIVMVRRETEDKILKDLDKMKTTFCEEIKDAVCRSYRDIVKEEVKKVHEDNPESGNEQVIIDKSASLIQERLDRRNNLILYNVPEEVVKGKDLSIRAEKIKQDIMIFKDLCAEIGVKCYDDDVIDIKRLGKYTGVSEEQASSKPRPILVTVGCGRKERVMRNLYKLKNCRNDLLRNIGISHDMNVEERKRDNELRREVQEKNMRERDTENFYVVRGPPWRRIIVCQKKKTTQGGQLQRGEGGSLGQVSNRWGPRQ